MDGHDIASTVIEEIVSKITNNVRVLQIVLFGSYANGAPGKNSDIDLLIVLDENGFSRSYLEKIDKRLKILKLLTNITGKKTVDLLVYTKDEWNKLEKTESSFIRNITKHGIPLI